MPFLHVVAQWLSVYPEVPKEQLSAQSTPLNSTSTGMPLRNGRFWLVGLTPISRRPVRLFFLAFLQPPSVCVAPRQSLLCLRLTFYGEWTQHHSQPRQHPDA